MEMYVNKIQLTGPVLGQLSPEENCPPLPPIPKTNHNSNLNPNPNRGAIFLRSNYPDNERSSL